MAIDVKNQVLFLFGGSGLTGSTTPVTFNSAVLNVLKCLCLGLFNDLWMFNLTNRWWMWVNGSNSVDQPGSYGTKGVASVTNMPNARYGHSMAIDIAGRFLYVLGGSKTSGWGRLSCPI